MINDTLAGELGEETDLDAHNDLEYLLGLAGEATESDTFENDADRARWTVVHWCQEVDYLPDVREYETGQIVPIGEVPPNDELRLDELPSDDEGERPDQ